MFTPGLCGVDSVGIQANAASAASGGHGHPGSAPFQPTGAVRKQVRGHLCGPDLETTRGPCARVWLEWSHAQWRLAVQSRWVGGSGLAPEIGHL